MKYDVHMQVQDMILSAIMFCYSAKYNYRYLLYVQTPKA